MNRESRANLIFLALFLAISIPGLILLVRKKMDPLARPMWIPDGRRNSVVYIDPIDAPPTMRRIAPAITSMWLSDEARERFGFAGIATTVDDAGVTMPVVSSNRYFQLLGVKPQADRTEVVLAFWNLPRGDGPISLRISTGATALPVKLTESPVPAAVKRDLQDSGMPRPPQRLAWVETSLALSSDGAATLTFDGVMDGQPFSDTLVLRGD